LTTNTSNEKAVVARREPGHVVYNNLRADVLSGYLKPGSKVPIDLLGKRYGTSQSPIREALNRLASEGLIRREDNRGFFVMAVDGSTLDELVMTRCWLEERALREALAHRTPEWEERLVVALHWLSRCPRYLDGNHHKLNPDWEIRHKNFHQALISACPSSILQRYCRELRDRVDSYRFMAESGRPEPFEKRPDEHRMIVDAVLNGDVEQAVDLLVSHYRRSHEIMRVYFESGA
jgi:GntR family carbon starvation induced transcriptional regulator